MLPLGEGRVGSAVELVRLRVVVAFVVWVKNAHGIVTSCKISPQTGANRFLRARLRNADLAARDRTNRRRLREACQIHFALPHGQRI
jgi:hypothetical protein